MAKDDNLKVNNKYGAEQITVLEGLEAVRKRPGMYIGGTGPDGLAQIIKEIVDNSVDEALAGHCDTITVSVFPDNYISIEDNGRGIPIDTHEKTGKSALETVLTTLHAGGKFGDGGYKVSSGLHGVGLTVTNALSEWMRVDVHKDGKHYSIELSRGKVTKEFALIGETDKQGTTVSFKGDEKIFESVVIDVKKLIASLKQRAYLVGGLRFVFKNYRDALEKKTTESEDQDFSETNESVNLDDDNIESSKSNNSDSFGAEKVNFLPDINGVSLASIKPIVEEFYYEGGVRSYIEGLVKPENRIGEVFHVRNSDLPTAVEVGFVYTDRIDYSITAFANLVINPDGGTHLTGFKQALTKTINDYARRNQLLKDKDENLSGEDILEGIVTVISVKLEDPQFEGQTKIKLNNTEVAGHVKTVLNEALTQWLDERPKSSKAIIAKCIISQKARKAAKAARESVIRKSIVEGAGLPGKLADCSEKNPELCELFIVEGDSAGGSAKQGRDRMTQAILPLKGKPLNSEKGRLDKVLAHSGLKNVVQALGTGIGESFDIKKLRYHKIILLADADVDGSHITTLLLTFFFRQMKELITHGHIYIGQPPLFRIILGKDKSFYVQDDREKEQKLKELSKSKMKITINRFKGLGEMNADQLFDTTLNPETRILKQVDIEDAELANNIFETLMGSDVPPRRDFIETNAVYADLDI